jgi:hypothetical protein
MDGVSFTKIKLSKPNGSSLRLLELPKLMLLLLLLDEGPLVKFPSDADRELLLLLLVLTVEATTTPVRAPAAIADNIAAPMAILTETANPVAPAAPAVANAALDITVPPLAADDAAA